MTAARTPQFTWRRLAPGDFGLLAGWLAQPHVRRWWNHEFTPEAIERDFGPVTRNEEPAEDLVVYADGTPVGLVQRCRWWDYPEYLDDLVELVDIPDEALTIDYLIGEVGLIGHGLGTAMIRAILGGTWMEYPRADCVIVPVAAANVASWRVLEKVGMRRVARGHMRPDNPVDDGDHVVYRIDRPTRGE
ncbi:GNAT family N-acetyltransferase [Nocardia sp. NPDC003482]|uniref:GNAT family N-acetyltransferase n=1 Tax=Nocardia sp. NPDC004068 TaxID=3364303 RepID=UPI0036C289D2